MRSLAYVRLGEENGGIIVNLSERGMAVRAVMGVRHDRVPLLRFTLSDSRDSIATSGRIAWKCDAGKLAGVQFVDMPEPMRDLIRSWVMEENFPGTRREAKTAAAPGTRGRFPPQPASKTIAISQDELEAGGQKHATHNPSSVAAPADPSPILPFPAMPGAASLPAADNLPGGDVSHARKLHPALLIAAAAVLSVIAGWATGPFLGHAFQRIWRSKFNEHNASLSLNSFVRTARPQPPALSQPPQSAGSGKQGWIFLGEITPESTWAADSLKIVRNGGWPIEKGNHITIGHDVWMRDGSRPSAHVVGRLRLGETVLVEEVTLLHKRRGGNFVWARVRTAAAAKP
jgi:hypothetical protein